MEIVRISGHGKYGPKIALACITSSLENSARAVLNVTGDSTTAGVLAMCSKPVPYAIVLHDFDPAGRISLDELASEPRMQKVLCFVEMSAAMPDDALDDVLPITITSSTAETLRLISASAGLLSRSADSDGGDHD